MGGGSGGGTQTTVQKADPWIGVQPALSQLYGSLTGAYNAGQLSPQQSAGTQVPWTGYQQLAFDNAYQGNQDATAYTKALASGNFGFSPGAGALLNIANGSLNNSQLGNIAAGNFGTNVATAQLAKTANGAYLDPNNPAIQGLLAAQSQPVVKNFQNATLPGLLSAYSAAGRYGSGANDAAIGAASDSLGQTLSNLAQTTIGQNYANERSNQVNAANQLAGLLSGSSQFLDTARSNAANSIANIQGSAISALPGVSSGNLNVANILQQYLQRGQDLSTAQQNLNASMPLTALQNLAGLLTNGMALTGQSSTGTSLPNSGGFGGALRGGLGGAATGAALGSIVPGIGTGIGALGGGVLGLLGGLL